MYLLISMFTVIELSESGHHLPLIERVRLSDETARSHPVDENDDVIHYYEHAADGGDVNAQVHSLSPFDIVPFISKPSFSCLN